MFRRLLSLRHVAVLLLIVVGVPGTAGAITAQRPETTFVPTSGPTPDVSAAPGQIVVEPIQFALQRDASAQPISPDTRFRYGTRQVWAFFNVREATPGDRLRWIFRFAEIDVNWGDVVAETREGRAVLLLERQDGQPLMVGRFDLIVNVLNGQTLQVGTFEIVDESGSSSNDNDDSDNEDADNDDSDNEDADNDDSDNEDADNDDSDNEDSDNEDADNDDSDNDDSDNEDSDNDDSDNDDSGNDND